MDKSQPGDLARFQTLLRESHLLLLPTQADCSPAVLREGCAFAVPALTTDVGGIRGLIREGINGRIFAPGTGAEPYVQAITRLMADRDAYQRLALAAQHDYQTRLSWSVSAATLAGWMRELQTAGGRDPVHG